MKKWLVIVVVAVALAVAGCGTTASVVAVSVYDGVDSTKVDVTNHLTNEVSTSLDSTCTTFLKN